MTSVAGNFVAASVGSLSILDEAAGLSLLEKMLLKEKALGVIVRVTFVSLGEGFLEGTSTSEKTAITSILVARGVKNFTKGNIVGDSVPKSVEVSAGSAVSNLTKMGIPRDEVGDGLEAVADGVVENTGSLKIEKKVYADVISGMSKGAVSSLGSLSVDSSVAASISVAFAGKVLRKVEKDPLSQGTLARVSARMTKAVLGSMDEAGVKQEEILSASSELVETVSSVVATFKSLTQYIADAMALIAEGAVDGLSQSGLTESQIISASVEVSASINRGVTKSVTELDRLAAIQDRVKQSTVGALREVAPSADLTATSEALDKNSEKFLDDLEAKQSGEDDPQETDPNPDTSTGGSSDQNNGSNPDSQAPDSGDDSQKPVTLPTLSVQDVRVSESEKEVLVTLSLDSPTAEALSISYKTVDGTAKAALDYEAQEQSTSFPAGQTSIQIALGLIQDDIKEEDETFTLELQADQSLMKLAKSFVTVTIADAGIDVLPSLTMSNLSVQEGTQAKLVASLSSQATKEVSFKLGLSGGTAKVDEDFVHLPDQLWKIPVGESSVEINLEIKADEILEVSEEIKFTLSEPSNVTLGTTEVTVTIAADYVLNVADIRVGENVGKAVLTALIRDKNGSPATLTQAATLRYRTLAGSGAGTTGATNLVDATPEVDYVALSEQSLVIPAGESSKQFTVDIRYFTYEPYSATSEAGTALDGYPTYLNIARQQGSYQEGGAEATGEVVTLELSADGVGLQRKEVRITINKNFRPSDYLGFYRVLLHPDFMGCDLDRACLDKPFAVKNLDILGTTNFVPKNQSVYDLAGGQWWTRKNAVWNPGQATDSPAQVVRLNYEAQMADGATGTSSSYDKRPILLENHRVIPYSTRVLRIFLEGGQYQLMMFSNFSPVRNYIWDSDKLEFVRRISETKTHHISLEPNGKLAGGTYQLEGREWECSENCGSSDKAQQTFSPQFPSMGHLKLERIKQQPTATGLPVDAGGAFISGSSFVNTEINRIQIFYGSEWFNLGGYSDGIIRASYSGEAYSSAVDGVQIEVTPNTDTTIDPRIQFSCDYDEPDRNTLMVRHSAAETYPTGYGWTGAYAKTNYFLTIRAENFNLIDELTTTDGYLAHAYLTAEGKLVREGDFCWFGTKDQAYRGVDLRQLLKKGRNYYIYYQNSGSYPSGGDGNSRVLGKIKISF